MVTSEYLTTTRVCPYSRASSRGRYLRTNPVMSAAMRIAVPLADSQLKVNTAGSAVARATTGGIRWIILSRPGTASFGAEIASSRALTLGNPQMNTITDSRTQGSHGDGPVALVAATGWTALRSSFPPRHTRRKAVRQSIEVTEAIMSTSHGP